MNTNILQFLCFLLDGSFLVFTASIVSAHVLLCIFTSNLFLRTKQRKNEWLKTIIIYLLVLLRSGPASGNFCGPHPGSLTQLKSSGALAGLRWPRPHSDVRWGCQLKRPASFLVRDNPDFCTWQLDSKRANLEAAGFTGAMP